MSKSKPTSVPTPNPIPELPDDSLTVGDRIKAARVAAGLTQAQLASLLGVTPPAVSNIERPGRKPSVHVLIRVAKALQCNLSDLLPELSENSSNAPLVLIPSPSPSLWVARDAAARESLEALGWRIGVRTRELPRLIQAATDAGVGVSIRGDFLAASVIPVSDRDEDGLGIEYRRRVYAWAAETVPNNAFSPAVREVFRRFVVELEPAKQVAEEMGIGLGSVKQMASQARLYYHELLESRTGRMAAAGILEELAGPIEGELLRASDRVERETVDPASDDEDEAQEPPKRGPGRPRKVQVAQGDVVLPAPKASEAEADTVIEQTEAVSVQGHARPKAPATPPIPVRRGRGRPKKHR